MNKNRTNDYFIKHLKDSYRDRVKATKNDKDGDFNVKESIKESIDKELKKDGENYYCCV